MNMNSICALISLQSHLLYYGDSFIDHCITLDPCLYYFGKDKRMEYIIFSTRSARTISKFILDYTLVIPCYQIKSKVLSLKAITLSF